MVVVFGSINLDLVARVARLPRAGETVAGDGFTTVPGGKGANQALAARHAGARVAMYGAVGRDGFADVALANLAAAGVDLGGVARVDAQTGVALINVDAHGENAITVIAGANGEARASQVPDAALGPGVTVLLQLELPVAEVAAVARRARAARARVVLNGAPASPLPDTVWPNIDVFVVNEREAAFYGESLGVGGSPEDVLATWEERFGVTAVLTLGARGALAREHGQLVQAEPPPVTVIDSTGAGDALAGALAAALDAGASLASALAAGVAAGASACTHAGAQRSL